jgi:hypothetical protein
MEKSLINEFKNSSSTLFHSTVLGTNSLLAQRSPKEHDIFKSFYKNADPVLPISQPITERISLAN